MDWLVWKPDAKVCTINDLIWNYNIAYQFETFTNPSTIVVKYSCIECDWTSIFLWQMRSCKIHSCSKHRLICKGTWHECNCGLTTMYLLSWQWQETTSKIIL